MYRHACTVTMRTSPAYVNHTALFQSSERCGSYKKCSVVDQNLFREVEIENKRQIKKIRELGVSQ